MADNRKLSRGWEMADASLWNTTGSASSGQISFDGLMISASMAENLMEQQALAVEAGEEANLQFHDASTIMVEAARVSDDGSQVYGKGYGKDVVSARTDLASQFDDLVVKDGELYIVETSTAKVNTQAYTRGSDGGLVGGRLEERTFTTLVRLSEANPRMFTKGGNDRLDLTMSKIGLGGGGLLYGIGENAAAGSGYWLGKNGKHYSSGWGGNQHTGSRSGALKASKAYKLAGRAAFIAGAAFSLYDAGVGIYNNDYRATGKAGLDFTMGTISTFGGPIGLGIGGGYFIIDATIGWGNAIDAGTQNIQQNQSILGPGWNAFRMEGGLK